MKPTPNDIHHVLRSIENAERDPSHPRSIARKAIEEFRSNAQREGLPTTNTHDDKGARVLDRDRVVRRSYPAYATGEVKRPWWARFRR